MADIKTILRELSVILKNPAFSDYLNALVKPQKLFKEVHVFRYFAETELNDWFNYTYKKLIAEVVKATDGSTVKNLLEWTKSVWTFSAVSARSVGHPAPFPEELPRRLIQLYTFEEDVVLDPFCGSGTTCLAALKDNRHYIGYDTEKNYVALANQRIREHLRQLSPAKIKKVSNL